MQIVEVRGINTKYTKSWFGWYKILENSKKCETENKNEIRILKDEKRQVS